MQHALKLLYVRTAKRVPVLHFKYTHYRWNAKVTFKTYCRKYHLIKNTPHIKKNPAHGGILFLFVAMKSYFIFKPLIALLFVGSKASIFFHAASAFILSRFTV